MVNEKIIKNFLKLKEVDEQLKILKKYPERLSWSTLIHIQDSPNADIRNLARNIVLKRPCRDFDFESVVTFMRIYGAGGKLAKAIIMKNFANKLSYKQLIELEENPYTCIRDMSREIILKRFPDRLDRKTLVDFQWSEGVVGKRAREIELKNFPKKLNLALLLRFRLSSFYYLIEIIKRFDNKLNHLCSSQ